MIPRASIPMSFQTLVVRRQPRMVTLTISRTDVGNSINSTLIRELGAALDAAEQDPDCRSFVLEGAPGLFCTGMDFHEATKSGGAAAGAVGIDDYLKLLKRFTLSPKVIICLVDGKTIAGGVGLVAASDFVIATPRAEFSLSEALWGLLPCCVLPFLIRRVGFQRAYTMTLTTRPVSAATALEARLVDELADDGREALRKLLLRLNLLESETVLDLKRYFNRLWALSPEVERLAVEEITRLAGSPRVQRHISNYLQHGTFPWEGQSNPPSK